MMKKEIFLKQLADPPKEYRPIPFWSWNEKLDVEETRRQIEIMDAAGIGGYFMHARGGLQTEYMGSAWMDNIQAGIDEGRSRGMGAWAYDENGWPSGFGDGKVNGRGETYQQKYLRYEFVGDAVPRQDGRSISHAVLEDGRILHFYYDVNPFYVDTLDKDVVRTFIEEIYVPYRHRFEGDFGKAMPGFFTDEPQVSRNGIPWSLTLPQAYQKAYGEDLLPLLPQIFLSVGTYKRTRYRFWHLIQELFVIHFTQQIYDWCETNGARLTGHMVLEETLLSQLTSNGAVMPHYEFFHIPGMDWLGRHIQPPTTPLQVASVAHQLGKRQILSETFALTGWNAGFEDLKWLYEWQMVRGVTQLCQHLQGYSLRGIRKRDYPPSLFYQQPWWDQYRVFNDAMSRIGMLLSIGNADFRVLVVHPQSSAWLCYDNQTNEGMDELYSGFLELTHTLEAAHVPFHYGDERILKRHGRIDGSTLRVGLQTYDVLIMPPMDTMASSTAQLLKSYTDNGGNLYWVGRKPSLVEGEASPSLVEWMHRGVLIPSPDALIRHLPEGPDSILVTTAEGSKLGAITVTRRNMPEEIAGVPFRLYYFVNSERENAHAAVIRLPGAAAWCFDPLDGHIKAVEQILENGSVVLRHTFEPMASLVLFVSDEMEAFNPSGYAACCTYSKPLETEGLAGDWEVVLSEPNVLTLDVCDFWFDGVLQAEKEHVSVIQGRACQLERPVDIRMRFEVMVEEGFIPDGALFLVMERPEAHRIRLNGQEVSNHPCGHYHDRSFRKLDIQGLLKPGRNVLWIETAFMQSPEIYDRLRKAQIFEAEKNKLTYDSEVEAVYILGRFGVSTLGTFTPLPKKAVRYTGDFVLSPLPTRVSIGDLTHQGFPFYAGSLRLTRKIHLKGDEIQERSFKLKENMAVITGLRVNGRPVSTWYWRPFEVDLDGCLIPGENLVELELTGSLRNMLGPHHLEEGESYAVSPASFFKEPGVWGGGAPWNDGYCFMPFGIRI